MAIEYNVWREGETLPFPVWRDVWNGVQLQVWQLVEWIGMETSMKCLRLVLHFLPVVSVVSVAAVPELAPCLWPALSHLSQSPAVKGSTTDLHVFTPPPQHIRKRNSWGNPLIVHVYVPIV